MSATFIFSLGMALLYRLLKCADQLLLWLLLLLKPVMVRSVLLKKLGGKLRLFTWDVDPEPSPLLLPTFSCMIGMLGPKASSITGTSSTSDCVPEDAAVNAGWANPDMSCVVGHTPKGLLFGMVCESPDGRADQGSKKLSATPEIGSIGCIQQSLVVDCVVSFVLTGSRLAKSIVDSWLSDNP